MDEQVWAALAKDVRPALTDYLISAEDVKGPFLAKIPTDMTELSKLDAVGFTSPVEELAERFHMDEALLRTLNPVSTSPPRGPRSWWPRSGLTSSRRR